MAATIAQTDKSEMREENPTKFPPAKLPKGMKLESGEVVMHSFRAIAYTMEKKAFFPKWIPNKEEVPLWLHVTNQRLIFVAETIPVAEKVGVGAFLLAASITYPGLTLVAVKAITSRRYELDRKRRGFTFSVSRKQARSLHAFDCKGQRLICLSEVEYGEWVVFKISDPADFWGTEKSAEFMSIARMLGFIE